MLVSLIIQGCVSPVENAILYNAGHCSALMQYVALRLTHHTDKKAILLIAEVPDKEKIKRLERHGIFDEVIFYDDSKFVKSNYDFLEDNSVFFEDLLEQNNLDWVSFDEIYTAADQINAVGLHLVHRGIRHNMIELAPNQFRQSWRSKTMMDSKILSAEFHEVQMKTGVITGNNPLITLIRSNYDRIMKQNNIDFTELLYRIDPKYKTMLSTIFEVPPISDSSQLLVMNSFWNCSGNTIFPYDQAPYIYQMILDYLVDLSEETIIKQHPNDRILLSDFPYKSLDKDIPLELLCVSDNIRLSRTISIQSTATDKIKNMIVEDVRLGHGFFALCHLMHHIYIISSILIERGLTERPIFTGLTSHPSEASSMSVVLSILFKRKIEVKKLEDPKKIRNSIIISTPTSGLIDDSNVHFIVNYIKDARCADILPRIYGLTAVDIALAPYDNFKGDMLIQRFFITGLKWDGPNKCVEKRLDNCHASLSYNIFSFVADYSNSSETLVEPDINVFDADILDRIERTYKEGRGRSNLNLTAKWMRAGWNMNELFDILWKNDTPESRAEMIRVATAFAATGDGGAMIRLGRAYRDGRGVGRNLNTAAEWMRKATDANIGWAKNELFDVLWKIDTTESRAEMIRVATDFAATGNGEAMVRIGRAYRDGKGVPQDLYESSDWFRKAIENNVGWARNELFDVLWQISDPSINLLEVITPLIEAKSGEAMIRMGRLYRDGKDVAQDLYASADWFRKAIENNVGRARNELFDVLWRIGTPESYSEMISLITPLAEVGDGNAMARLGRAYRDGKGVCRDHSIAAQWYTKAKDRGIPWAEKELARLDIKKD